jgi:hypothetical protein
MKRCHRTSVFKRLVAIIIRLAEINNPFNRIVDKLCNKSNGNFLGQTVLITKFDPVMKEHVRHFVNNRNSFHYLSNKVQNDLIQKSSEEVTS